MDQPGLDGAAHREALEALRRVNGLSAGVRAVWPLIRAFSEERRRKGDSRPVRVLDLATGGGDFPVRLWKRARKAGVALEIAGCDMSDLAVDHASAHALNAGAAVRFFRHDVLADPLPEGYDVLTSSLFLHHLDEPEAIELLRRMRQAGELVLVDDLLRSPVGWLLAYAGIRILSRSKVAHVDGPLSVEGAFTCEEVRELARLAGWPEADVTPRFPCRFLLVGRRA
ncbi:methyltransferase domain-containing protein [Isosphaeraceae bacterium EP7]